ncbi:hypothetical protein, partial [Escherichia coli]|nr:hypothetical protein [Escherichia coli]
IALTLALMLDKHPLKNNDIRSSVSNRDRQAIIRNISVTSPENPWLVIKAAANAGLLGSSNR